MWRYRRSPLVSLSLRERASPLVIRFSLAEREARFARFARPSVTRALHQRFRITFGEARPLLALRETFGEARESERPEVMLASREKRAPWINHTLGRPDDYSSLFSLVFSLIKVLLVTVGEAQRER
jgi:hypothetical protein